MGTLYGNLHRQKVGTAIPSKENGRRQRYVIRVHMASVLGPLIGLSEMSELPPTNSPLSFLRVLLLLLLGD